MEIESLNTSVRVCAWHFKITDSLRSSAAQEHVGTHVDLLASEGELRRTRDCLELKEKELKALGRCGT